jgi:molecular chaperone DnaJ
MPPGASPGGQAGPGGFSYTVNLEDIGDLGDIFGNVFSGFAGRGGAGQATASARRGADLQYDVQLTFAEALEGVSKKVEVRRAEKCSVCKGTGAKPGTSRTTCPSCKGSGNVSQGQGLFGVSRPCPRCQGAGTIIEQPCTACRGAGMVTKVKLKVPEGTQDGRVFRIGGKGAPKLKGKGNGDLNVRARIAVPSKLTTEQKELLKRFESARAEDVRSHIV